MTGYERQRPIPESEQNPPEDRSMGFQPWPGHPGIERWWMGSQWGESYRAAEEKAS